MSLGQSSSDSSSGSSFGSSFVGNGPSVKKLLEMVKGSRIHQSLIFSGPEGVGKKKLALLWIQALLCEADKKSEVLSSCGQCGSCLRLLKGQHESLFVVEPSGLSIKVDQAKECIQFLGLRSLSKKRFILINEAQKLNVQASNALLKIVEEPPADSYFIFITSSLEAIVQTLRSRSQVISFGPLKPSELKQVQPDAEEWQILASMGSLAKLSDLESEDEQTLRKDSHRFLYTLLRGAFVDATDLSKPLIESSPKALKAISYICNAIVATLKNQKGLVPIELESLLVSQSPHILSEMLNSLLLLEKNILSNADKKIAFDHWVYQWNDQLFSGQ